MGCGATKENIESEILILRLMRTKIQEERAQILSELEKISGTKIIRASIPDYLIHSENESQKGENGNKEDQKEVKKIKKKKSKKSNKTKIKKKQSTKADENAVESLEDDDDLESDEEEEDVKEEDLKED